MSAARRVREPSFGVAGAGTRFVVAWTGLGRSGVYVRTFDTASGWSAITRLAPPSVSSGQVPPFFRGESLPMRHSGDLLLYGDTQPLVADPLTLPDRVSTG